MALLNISCLAFASLVIAGILISGSGSRVSAQVCEGDFQGLVSQCSKYVQITGPKTPPSQPCCDIVKKADVPCVCKHITKEVETFISMEKVVYVANYCGKPLPHGIKCGSYTIPPA